MDRRLRRILTESIQDIETGSGDLESRIQPHPELEAEFRSLVDLRQRLESAVPAKVNPTRLELNKQKFLTVLASHEGSDQRMVPTILAARAAAVIAGIALMAASTAGVSAALGGPDVGGEVLSATGINNAPDAAQNGKDHANENAFEGSDNAGQGIENASEAGREHANENAFKARGDAGDETSAESADAAENGLDTANDHAAEQADDGLETAADAGPQADVPPATPTPPEHPTPPAGPPASDDVPEDVPVPDSVPVGH
jgi:hypothetical protein